jgi:ATP-dependent Clp protease adaptor protein ClpS
MTWPAQSNPDTETLTEVSRDLPWSVVVYNDPVNLMTYVAMVFRKVFGFDAERSRQHMLEVHEQGRSTVWSGSRERAEAYAHTLKEWQLTAQIEQADS